MIGELQGNTVSDFVPDTFPYMEDDKGAWMRETRNIYRILITYFFQSNDEIEMASHSEAIMQFQVYYVFFMRI